MPTPDPRVDACIARAVAYAPHSDLIWMETSKPDLAQAKWFPDGEHKHHAGQMLAYSHPEIVAEALAEA